MALEPQGIGVVLGWETHQGILSGVRAQGDRWVKVSEPVHAIHDRFPSQQRHAAWLQAQRGLPGILWSNPTSLVALCRDKVASQRVLERARLPIPPIEARPEEFQHALQRWGGGFLKPRFGALGYGVHTLAPSDVAPPSAPAWDGGPRQATLVQRAVLPPSGWAGVTVRANVQREEDGSWYVLPMVVRRSQDDPVVNTARGAEVVAAVDVMPAVIPKLQRLARRTARAVSDHPDGHALLELGVDFAIDEAHEPWILEVNTRPRGRLRSLHQLDPVRWANAHLEAYTRPLRVLAHQVQNPSH